MDVPIRCLCPGTPHDEDTVTLSDSLGFFEASSIRNAVLVLKEADPNSTAGEVLAVMTEAMLRAGIASWTLTDGGKPVEVSRQAISTRILPELDVAMQLGEVADQLYRAVMLPLLLRAFKSSPGSPTRRPTSPTNGSPQKRPKRSKQSSISTIPTAGTEATSKSLAGVSSSSQNSESAA